MERFIQLILIICFFFFNGKSAKAQDYHFSQFDTAPLYTNPALTGFMKARNRIAVKYRNQWSSVLQDNAYKTMLISYDGRVCPNGNVTVAYGLNLVRDQVGFPSFRTNHYVGSVAFQVKINGTTSMSGGLQGGLLQYRLDLNNLKIENQFDGFIGFDQSLPSMENFLDNQPINILDLGGGVLLHSTDKAWNVGVAFHHINPKNYYAFTSSGEEGDNRPKVRWVIHGIVPFQFGKNVVAIRKMSIIQLPHWQTNIGFDFRYQISKNNQNPFLNGIIFGFGVRASNRQKNAIVTDAILFSGKTDIGNGLLLGFGYDWNISPLKRSSYTRGGVEASLVWEFPIREKENCLECPDINKGTYGKGLWQIW